MAWLGRPAAAAAAAAAVMTISAGLLLLLPAKIGCPPLLHLLLPRPLQLPVADRHTPYASQ